ncbi:transcriptional regulator HU subunit alpha [Achromatium sp. WMS2]|nr:transcriptional regulator HU subunit alpha [Achromatium sp. WMS2]
MNKAELINAVAETANISKATASQALDGMTKAITKALQDGDSVSLIGFGTFLVKERAARTGRNPKTGKPLEIAASRVPSFRAGKTLKDAVNDPSPDDEL